MVKSVISHDEVVIIKQKSNPNYPYLVMKDLNNKPKAEMIQMITR